MVEHLISTTVTAQQCQRCGGWVLAAWEDGLFTLCDPAEVTREGELVAMFTGRRTYVLHRKELVARTAWRTDLTGPVVIEHRCGDPPQCVAAPGDAPAQWSYHVDPDGPIPF